ncbi:hypothetical protein [uncultured Clostridium sp.]|uniref:hypothetical protein n=1 Tax=uncultured Clostridium sp. TaxID=59620 RepID=UPI0026125C3F|nr:hypothetical protein [uncultured Clostridium sp.]
MAIDTTEANLYGTGKGEAFVWGQNRALGMLQQQYQQDQLRRQKEDAEIADQVGKINYDAARQEDLPELMKRYSDIKNTFSKYRGTQDAMDRIRLQADMNQKKADFSRAVNLSKQAGQQLGELGKLRLSKPDEISDNFGTNYKNLAGLSVFDPRFKELADQTSNTALAPKLDEIGIAKKIADASVNVLPQGQVKVQNLPDGGKSYYTEKGKELSLDAIKQNAIAEAQSNRPLQRYLAKTFPGKTMAESIDQYSQGIYDGMKGKYNQRERVGASVIKPDNWKEKANYQDALIRARKEDGVTGSNKNQNTFWQEVTNRVIDNEPGSGEFITDAIKANVAKNNQSLSGRIKVEDDRNKGVRVITIPAITRQRVKVIPGKETQTSVENVKPEQKFIIDPNDRAGSARKITDMINIYTAEKEPYRKQFTESGKGKVSTGKGAEGLRGTPPQSTGKRIIKGF